jgi:hypothetical protein
LWEIRATIEIKDLWLPKTQCENDQFLMTAFASMKASKPEMIMLNNWRLYYKVLLLSEICFALGQGIHPHYLKYVDHPRKSSTKLNWPIQGKPDEASLKIWKKYL